MKILISAAETSSDAHGAELLKALRAQDASVVAFGVGGPKLQSAGLRVVVDARELLSMGFFEIVSRLPRIFRALTEVAREAALERPDVAVVLDYPDFHFRLAKRLKRLGIPVVYYIPPKVWVWRKKRIRFLKENFARVLSILPFEEPFYEKAGVAVRYVGNPLVDELPLSLTREVARRRLGIGTAEKTLVLMPGSRPSEIKRHLELMLDAALLAARSMREQGALETAELLRVLMPFPLTSALKPLEKRVAAWQAQVSGPEILRVSVSRGDADECLVAADAGLIKSGTSTLEAGMLGCPHAVVYKPSRVTEWIFKNLIRYRGPVGLVNLVAGWSPVRPYLVNEILMSDATVEALSGEVTQLFGDPVRRGVLRDGFAALKKQVMAGGETSPSVRAAAEVLSVAREHSGKQA